MSTTVGGTLAPTAIWDPLRTIHGGCDRVPAACVIEHDTEQRHAMLTDIANHIANAGGIVIAARQGDRHDLGYPSLPEHEALAQAFEWMPTATHDEPVVLVLPTLEYPLPETRRLLAKLETWRHAYAIVGSNTFLDLNAHHRDWSPLRFPLVWEDGDLHGTVGNQVNAA